MKKANKRSLEAAGATVIHSMKDERTGKVYGYICIVPFDLIGFAGYQRQELGGHIEKIGGDGFEIGIATDLMISFRPEKSGDFWCYDGRQHMAAMSKLGYTAHYAKVYTNLTYKDEARRFFKCNDTVRKMNGWVKFKAAYTAGDKTFISLIKIAREYKLITPICHGVDRAKDADIKNPSILLEPFKRGGLRLVREHCKVLNACFRTSNGRLQTDAKKIELTRGLATFLQTFCMGDNPLPYKTVKMVLKNISAEELACEANYQKSARRPDARQFYDALCQLFGKCDDQLSLTAHLKEAA
jgi:hypothetical protein